MAKSAFTTKDFFELRFIWLVITPLAICVAILLFNSHRAFFYFEKPILVLLCFFILFSFVLKLSGWLTDKFLSLLRVEYPTVMLWCYPTAAVFSSAFFGWLLCRCTAEYLGRGYFKHLLGFTMQDTASLLFTCFASILVFVVIQFFLAVNAVVNWLLGIAKRHFIELHVMAAQASANQKQQSIESFAKINAEVKILKNNRVRASKVNRIALVGVCLFGAAMFGFVNWRCPAVILYYKAEVQQKIYSQPQKALEILNYLLLTHPQYKYADSVTFKRAWLLDRRLSLYDEAKKAYEEFLKKYGDNNVWSDEVISSLVRICADKQKDSNGTLFWTSRYLNTFPRGLMAPYMYLYRIRAFHGINQKSEAENEIKAAKKAFENAKMCVVNKEDMLINVINFSEALEAETADFTPPANQSSADANTTSASP